MMKNKTDKELILALCTIVITLAIGVSAWFFYLSQETAVINGLINSVAKNNEHLVRVMADQIETQAKSEEDAFEILASTPSDGIFYWSLYAEDALVFEKDKATTDLMSGFSRKDVENYYLRQGGTGSGELFHQMEQETVFSILVSKNKQTGNELISAEFLEIGENRYCLTVSILQSYLLSTGRVGETMQHLRILVVGLILVMTSGILYFSFQNRGKSHKLRALRGELQEKNLLVQEQGDRLFIDENDDLTMDIRTGLYSIAFFDGVMERLADLEDVQVGFIYFRLDNVSEMYGVAGYQGVSMFLAQSARILLNYATENDIAVRVSTAEFVLICFDASAESVHRLCRKIAVTLVELNEKASFSCGDSYASKGENPMQAYEKARKAAESK